MSVHMKQLRWASAVVGVVAVLLAAPAAAVTTLTLTGPIAGHVLGPQSQSAPCIIAGTTCQNPAGFAYNNFVSTGSISAYDELSPVYTISQFPFLTFNVAIDVNTTVEAGEYLEYFDIVLNGSTTPLYTFGSLVNTSSGAAIGGISNNGNGYGDWGLGIVDLSAYGASDTIQFRAKWHGASDGAESFFIVSTNPIPEPGTYALMLAGLAAVGFMARRRRQV